MLNEFSGTRPQNNAFTPNECTSEGYVSWHSLLYGTRLRTIACVLSLKVSRGAPFTKSTGAYGRPARYIESKFGFAVQNAEDSSVLSGDGTSANMLGIFATPGLQAIDQGSGHAP